MKRFPIYILTLFMCILLNSNVNAQYIINTIAGTDSMGYNGDNILAIDAKLFAPIGVTVDKNGFIYIADTYNNRVRKVDTNGIITTIAGGPATGYSGDGGPATAAMIDVPWYIAVDNKGNVFFSDRLNNRIRKIDTNNIISTYAGDSVYGYNGDNIVATAAELNNPQGIVLDDSGNMYIADVDNYRIRKVNTAGIISTIAGNGYLGNNGDGGQATNAEITYPYGIALDKYNNIYFTDYTKDIIRKIDQLGIITTIAGTDTFGYYGDGGPATLAKMDEPVGIVIDKIGNIYVSDAFNDRVRVIDTFGNINTFAGNGTPSFGGDNGPATAAELFEPDGLAFDSHGSLYIADFHNSRIRYIKNPLALPTLNEIKLEVNIYPNPSKGLININVLSDANFVGKIAIINMLGETIHTGIIEANVTRQIDLDLPGGIFFLNLITPYGVETKQFLVE